MSLDTVWAVYQTQGYSGVLQVAPEDALDLFYLAILAFGEQHVDQAAQYTQQALALAPDNLLYSEGATYLQRLVDAGNAQAGEGRGVYVTGDAFAVFIREGGNRPLYEKTSAALRQIYQSYEKIRLLDIGVGEGRALLGAISDKVQFVDVVEPSQAMLDKTTAALAKQGIQCQATCATLQEFVTQQTASWDVIEATYSLQSIPPKERLPLFRWLRAHGKQLVIAEFDVPEFSAMYTPERVRYIADRYQKGLAEYDDDGSMVAQGFLMPVMFGYFDQSATRTNYEQPIQQWIDQLKQAGFEKIKTRLLYPYWWASAYLIDAR